MSDEPLPDGFVLDEALPAGFTLDGMKDAPGSKPDRMADLGRMMFDALKESMLAASPFSKGPAIKASEEFAKSGAPGGMAALTGQDIPADAPIPAQIARQVMDPATLATVATGLATGGASIPARVGMQALTVGAGKALQEAGSQAAAGAVDPAAVLEQGSKAASISGLLEGLLGGSGRALTALKPKLTKLGAQMIRATSAVPEKYGKAVLDNPEILSEAGTLMGARAVYKAAIKDMGGVRDFLQNKTGKVIASQPAITDLINEAAPKIGTKTLALEEALAARQGISILLDAAKYGNPEQRANKAALVSLKNELDDYVEVGMPGFKAANRGYFEANAKEAFSSWLPQNKNMSPNVLRSLGALSSLGAASLLHAPGLMIAAAPMSPKATGLAIRGVSSAVTPASLAAKFAARIAASKSVGTTGGKQ